MSKIDPGPGYRLLEDEEIVQVGDEFLALDATWKPTKNPGVKFSRECVPKYYRRKALTLPIPGSPEDKASLAELDSLIPAPKAVNIVAPWPSADECRKSLEAAGIKPEDFAKSPGATILPGAVEEVRISGTVTLVPEGSVVVGPEHPWCPRVFTPNKYTRELLALDGRRVPVDVYSVLAAFPVGNAAVDHALKKLLAPGQRGQKDRLQDLKEARASLDRAIQMEGG